MSTVKTLKQHARDIDAAQQFLNAAYAKANAALTARNWALVEICKEDAQAALQAHFDALVAFHKAQAADDP